MAASDLHGVRVPIKLWARVNEVESGALDQLKNVSALQWVFHHVAAMADCHFGYGATVGSVIAMKDAVSPAAVGVDIGCGMAAVKTTIKAENLPDSLAGIRRDVERAIPVGFNWHKEPVATSVRHSLWEEFSLLSPEVKDQLTRAQQQLGTLGGGNHFIELCLDTEQCVWMMLHSGSRNIGKTLADVHIARAKKLAHNEGLPDRNLAVFLAGTPEMAAYRHDLTGRSGMR